MLGCFAYVYVCALLKHLVPEEARREYGSPEIGAIDSWVTMWMLETKSTYSVRTASAIKLVFIILSVPCPPRQFWLADQNEVVYFTVRKSPLLVPSSEFNHSRVNTKFLWSPSSTFPKRFKANWIKSEIPCETKKFFVELALPGTMDFLLYFFFLKN